MFIVSRQFSREMFDSNCANTTTTSHLLNTDQLSWSKLKTKRRPPRECHSMEANECQIDQQKQQSERIQFHADHWASLMMTADDRCESNSTSTSTTRSRRRMSLPQAQVSSITAAKKSFTRNLSLFISLSLVTLCVLSSCHPNLIIKSTLASSNTHPSQNANETSSAGHHHHQQSASSTSNSSDTNNFQLNTDKTRLVSNMNTQAHPQFKPTPPIRRGNQQREHPNYKTTYACEGSQMELNCQDGKLIHLVRANYGRFSLSICNDLGHSNYSVQCASFRAFLFMETRCNKLNNCNVTVSKELFGDPCEGTAKYLEVQYYCNDVNNNSNSNNSNKPTPQINGQQQNGRNNQQPTGAAATNGQLSNQNHKSQTGGVGNQQQVGGQLQTTTTDQDNNNSPVSPTTTTTTTNNTILDNNFVIQQQQQQQQTASFCSPQLSSRNLFWNSTRAGQVAQQSCPEGATGSAQWLCDSARLRFVPLHTPDFSQCRSIWLTRLAQQLDQMLEAPQKQQSIEMRRQSDEQMLRLVLGELTLMARTKELFGEDLKRMDIMVGQMIAELKSLAVLYNGNQQLQAAEWRPRNEFAFNLSSLYEQLFVKLANIVSSLFELGQKSAWLELSASDRRKLEFRFLNHAKESGLMLANSLPADQLQEAFQPVKFANVVAGITVLSGNSVQRHAANSDGTTGEFNLFNQQQQQQVNYLNNKFNLQNPFAMSDGEQSVADEQTQAATSRTEFRLSTSLADELASNGVGKFLIMDIKKPDYALMMRFHLEQQQLALAGANQISSSQFANELSGGQAATLFDSSSSPSPTQSAGGNLAADRFSARIFGLFAIAQDSGVAVLDGQQEQTAANTKQLEINNKLQDSLAQWPINVEFRIPTAGNELVARQCHSLSVAPFASQQEQSSSNRCQLSRANATHFVCTCDRFGFVSLTSISKSSGGQMSPSSSFPFPLGIIQNDQWPLGQQGPNFDFGQPTIANDQQLLGSRTQDSGEYGANYIQPNNKANSSLSVVTTIFIFIGLGLLVLSLGACGVSLIMRVSSADNSKFGKKQQGFLESLGARSGPTSGPMVIDHNLLGSDPLVNSAATTQSASIIGLSNQQQQQQLTNNSLITSCDEHNGTYKTHQQLYAANMDAANFGGIYSNARGDLRTTLASLIRRPASWLATVVGLKTGYSENNYDNSKANQMIHQHHHHHHHQSGLMGSPLNANHSTGNTLSTTAYKCQNGYTTSLGLYNPNQHHMIAQHRTLANTNNHNQQPHSVQLNSSSNSSYVSSSAYYEEIGPGNLTKVNPTSMTSSAAHHHQHLTPIDQFKRSAELQQQHNFNSNNNWSQRTLNNSNLIAANLISGQPMQTMGSNKHLIQHNDLSPLQSSSSSSSAGSQHSASTNLTTANSSTPRHYLFASSSAISAYKQQFKTQGP